MHSQRQICIIQPKQKKGGEAQHTWRRDEEEDNGTTSCHLIPFRRRHFVTFSSENGTDNRCEGGVRKKTSGGGDIVLLYLPIFFS